MWVIPEQRWVRPFIIDPGQYKRQLATKDLAVGARGNLPELRQLLRAHQEFINKRGSHNRTLLWEAARRGRLPAVKWLLKHGADLDATGCYNGETVVPVTPYCAAVYYRRPAIADYLLAAGAKVDIFRAAFLGDEPRVADWLAADPGLLHAEDPFDGTYFSSLLAFAVSGAQPAMVEYLVHKGAAVAPYTAQLLHLAVLRGRQDLVEQLVRYGADPRAADTALFLFASDLALVRYLLDQGLSPTRTSMNGFPPLIYLARGDKSERADKVQLLLERGADVNAVGPRGRTALHYAAAVGHTAVMQMLLEHNANPTLTDQSGATPLALAKAAGKTAAVKMLRNI